jgi:hypothetical protein
MDTFQSATPFEHKVFSDVVLCKQFVSGSGELLISAPPGVTIVNGQLTPALTATQAGDASLRSTVVLSGQVINQGVIPINIYAEGNTTPIVHNAELPWHDIVECACCNPGNKIVKENFTVRGFSVAGITINGLPFIYIIATFDYCFLCTQERILTIKASESCGQ